MRYSANEVKNANEIIGSRDNANEIIGLRDNANEIIGLSRIINFKSTSLLSSFNLMTF